MPVRKRKHRRRKKFKQQSNNTIKPLTLEATSNIDILPMLKSEPLENAAPDDEVRFEEKVKRIKLKLKQREELLLKSGIHKFWATHILEILFIFEIEILVKLLLGNLSFDFSLLRIFLSSCIISLILAVPTTNLPKRARALIILIIDFFIAFYAWLQLGFSNYIGMFISLGTAEQGTKITSLILEFLGSYKLVFYIVWIPFILVILYFVFERRITRNGYTRKLSFKEPIHDVALLAYFLILIFGFYITLEAGFMQKKLQTVSNKELFKYASNPSLAVNNFGTTVYFLLDIKGLMNGNNNEIAYYGRQTENNQEETDMSRVIDDEAWKNLIKIEKDPSYVALNNYFINRKITDKNEYTGIFKDKNLIMIMLESISEAVFYPEYKEYFPTLYKLYTEGITGVNNYSPRNNCATGESELTSEVSLYTIETTCTVNTYKDNEYKEALMYMIRNNGYYTSTYHDYNDQYYTRSVIEYKFGSFKYLDANGLNLKSGKTINSDWPSDLDFMEASLSEFINQERFATYMITVSAHMPYKNKSQTGEEYMSLFKDTKFSTATKRYLSKVKAADLALEHLLSALEEKGILDDTVLVLFGDHYPYGLSNKDYAELAPYDISTNQEIDRTPFIIYNSEVEPFEITKYTSPLDIAPTILNLFGIDYDPRYYMGHDVFSDYNDYVVFADNSWQSPYGFYSASKGEFIFKDDADPLSDDAIIAINTEVTDMRNMSNLAIKKNYFDYLYKYFDEYKELKKEREKGNALIAEGGLISSKEEKK